MAWLCLPEQCIDTIRYTPKPSPFLELPGEMRNLIYECATDGLVLTHNLFEPAIPCMFRYLMENGQLLDFDARPHPLLQVCRQIRSEFIPFLRSGPKL